MADYSNITFKNNGKLKLLIIVGMEKVVQYMIQNVDSKKRNTGLEYKMKKIKGD